MSLSLLLASIFLSTIPEAESKAPDNFAYMLKSGVHIVGHRACWGPYPENSLSAIRNCQHSGVSIIELDVRATKDGALYLLHDERVDRTTNAQGAIAGMSSYDASQLALKSGNGGQNAQVTSELLPTLEEGLRALPQNILVNLDVKADILPAAWEQVMALNIQSRVLMKSTKPAGSDDVAIIRHSEGALFMPILIECTPSKSSYCHQDPAAALASFSDMSPIAVEVIFTTDSYLKETIKAADHYGLPVWVNTLAKHHAAGRTDTLALHNPEKAWGELIEFGVDIIQTDKPHELSHYLKSRKQGVGF